MDNYQIADSLSLLAKLMDIHGENSFKSKSYSAAAFAIEKAGVQLSEIPFEKISSLKGLGSSTSQKVIELLQTGKISVLEEIILKTPPGVIEMMNIKGIGPKKIHTIWKEMEIESIGELLYACQENRLKIYKGFGEKTQQTIIDTIQFYLKNKESHLYAQLELLAPQTLSVLSGIIGEGKVFITGEFRRQLEVINTLDFIVLETGENIIQKLSDIPGFSQVQSEEDILFSLSAGVTIKLISADEKDVWMKLAITSSSPEFGTQLIEKLKVNSPVKSEEELFTASGLQYVPPALREDPNVLKLAEKSELPQIICEEDIKGIIHCHSNWSDGTHTIEQLAAAAITMGREYLVISDHSKSAFYANGLYEERIRAQHDYIDELNEKLKPFRIFKSIESDILNDGKLDYSNDVLASFDMVIASVHSNLKMTPEKANARLLAAVENPYTTILGHMTGRLLLSRNGYPADHKLIIDTCASNKVIVELNAHPNRLDIDWRHIGYALEKGVMISINPDAHFIDGLNDTKYGVLVAQKAMVSKTQNLSSMSLVEFENYITERKKMKGI